MRSQDKLYEFSTRTLGSLPGVRGVDIGLELRTIKRAYLRVERAFTAGPEVARGGGGMTAAGGDTMRAAVIREHGGPENMRVEQKPETFR